MPPIRSRRALPEVRHEHHSPPRESVRSEVRLLTRDDLDDAVDVLARGFAEEPGTLALFPDPEVRRALWELNARQALEETIRLGTVHAAVLDDEIAALAMWHPPGVRPSGALDRVRLLRHALPHAATLARGLPPATRVALPHALPALRIARARNTAVKPATREPTWHLAFLATLPEHRGKGLARRLLDRQLSRCDEDRLPVWLETTDPVNPPIYERFGFETIVHITDAAWLPGFWVMRREPTPEGLVGTP
jgi:GNAT superfamily N-acetyltransferase